MSQVWLLDFHTSELVLLLHLQETNGITVSFMQHFFSSTNVTWLYSSATLHDEMWLFGRTNILSDLCRSLTGSLWQTFILFVLNPAVYFYMNVNIYPLCQQYSCLNGADVSLRPDDGDCCDGVWNSAPVELFLQSVLHFSVMIKDEQLV